MGNIKDKTYVSKYPPKSVDSLWYNGKELKIFNNGRWNAVGGGSGGNVDSTTSMMLPVTWRELVALRDAANLTAGQMYRITDYETFCAWDGTQCAGHPFDIVVTALDNKTLDEKASAIWSARDTEGYFADCNLPAWDVRYCLDNDKDRFDWAVVPGKSIEVDLSSEGLPPSTGVQNGTFVYNETTYLKWDSFLNGTKVYILTPEDFKVGDSTIVYIVDGGFGMQIGSILSIIDIVNSGKGVIYRLIDENSNDVAYDFKNIMFKRPLKDGSYDKENGVDSFCYTFSRIDSNFGIHDNSKSGAHCYNNKIDKYSYNNIFIGLPNLMNPDISYCYLNTIGQYCTDNTFNGAASYTYIDGNCQGNLFTNYCAHIKLGQQCNDNVFGNNVRRVTLDDDCYENTFGDNCSDISLGYMSDRNSIGKSSSGIIFMHNGIGNVIGENCAHIKFGENCAHNTISSVADGSNPLNYSKWITFGGDNSNIVIWTSKTTDGGNHFKNVCIKQGTNDSYSEKLAIEIPVLKADYVQTVAKNSSGEIKVYCEADLVQ